MSTQKLYRTFALTLPDSVDEITRKDGSTVPPHTVLNLYYGLTIGCLTFGCLTFGTERERAAQFPTRKAASNHARRLHRPELRPLPIAVTELKEI